MNTRTLFSVLAAVISCGVTATAQAQEIEIGSGLMCDTQPRAERLASLLRGEDQDALSVVSAINAEENNPGACSVMEVEYLRGNEAGTIRTPHGTFRVQRILVIGRLKGAEVETAGPRIYFAVIKLDERRA